MSDGTPRTKAQCLAAVVKELNLDTTDPFTRVLAAAFALQDAYDESRAALARCQQIVHDQAPPSARREKVEICHNPQGSHGRWSATERHCYSCGVTVKHGDELQCRYVP